MATLASAREHYARQQRIQVEALRRARARRFGPLPVLVATLTAAQAITADEAVAAVPLMLAEQNIDSDPDVTIQPRALVGSASDGRDLAGLLDYTRSPSVTDEAFAMIVLTQLADTSRQSSALAMYARPQVTGYVRMLVPPSCSRCVVLAGRKYRKNAGFQRHPRCDCTHVPTAEVTAGDLTTDPREYFDSLPTAADVSRRYPDLTARQRRDMDLLSQEDVFTVAGARAIRDGADISRVVNARAGMSTAQPPLRGRGDRWTARGRAARVDVGFGRQAYTTTEATTKRGLNRGGRVRLMPESIYQFADSREDALRMLKAHGYIR